MSPPAVPTGDLGVEEVQDATGAPAKNVLRVWPLVLRALKSGGMASLRSQVGMAATIGTETPAFYPLKEFRASEEQARLRAQQDRYWGSGYYGRGLIQTTWEENYRLLETATGLPFLSQPDLLLDPEHAATAAAFYWKDRAVWRACDLGDWPKVRKLVNGGLNGWDHFSRIVVHLVRRHDPHTDD